MAVFYFSLEPFFFFNICFSANKTFSILNGSMPTFPFSVHVLFLMPNINATVLAPYKSSHFLFFLDKLLQIL